MTVSLIEAEVDRLVADMLPAGHSVGRLPGDPARGPMPTVPAIRIIEHAVDVVDAEGIEALTVRRLAADLEISTRTLYKRIQSHDNLVSNIAGMYLTRVEPPILAGALWPDTVMQWCLDLHRELTAHPNLTSMLTRDDLAALKARIDRLIESAVRRGAPPQKAGDLCRTLAMVTFNDAIAASRGSSTSTPAAPEVPRLRNVLELIFVGSLADSRGTLSGQAHSPV